LTETAGIRRAREGDLERRRRSSGPPLADGELTAGLRRIREREAAIGLDIRPRLAMRREPSPPEDGGVIPTPNRPVCGIGRAPEPA